MSKEIKKLEADIASALELQRIRVEKNTEKWRKRVEGAERLVFLKEFAPGSREVEKASLDYPALVRVTEATTNYYYDLENTITDLITVLGEAEAENGRLQRQLAGHQCLIADIRLGVKDPSKDARYTLSALDEILDEFYEQNLKQPAI